MLCITIALPFKKFNRWDMDLARIITKKKVSYSLLESTLGRLNHAAMACYVMRYFLSRIQSVLTSWDISNKTKKVEWFLSSQVLEDCKLWKDFFLPAIAKGMRINLVTYRRPTFFCWSDACPEGMGGFDHMGYAWRFQSPDGFREAVKKRNNHYYMASYPL